MWANEKQFNFDVFWRLKRKKLQPHKKRAWIVQSSVLKARARIGRKTLNFRISHLMTPPTPSLSGPHKCKHSKLHMSISNAHTTLIIIRINKRQIALKLKSAFFLKTFSNIQQSKTDPFTEFLRADVFFFTGVGGGRRGVRAIMRVLSAPKGQSSTER